MSPDPSAKLSQEVDLERDIHIEEWKAARAVLQFFDDKLHDLRKYGFSFITGLLAADGILLSTDPTKIVSDSFKEAVCFVIIILILALYLIDKNYLVFQKAAATRALVLERKLNIELSEIITDRYSIGHVEENVLGVYGLFSIAALILGWISLGAINGYLLLIGLIDLIGLIYIYRINVEFKYGNLKFYEDWIISPLVCYKNGTVKITLNNFTHKIVEKNLIDKVKRIFHRGVQIPEPIKFKKNDLLWTITNEETREIGIQTADRDMDIFDNHTWILKAKNIGKPGVYQFCPRDWPLPLQRRIVISDIPKK